MTESIDMAIAAARERGWIGYEESLAAEVAALRAENERLKVAYNFVLWDRRTDDMAMDALRRLDSLTTERDKARSEIAALRAAMSASDDRLRRAGERVGIVLGCDTADWMADEITALRAVLAETERALEVDVSEAFGVSTASIWRWVRAAGVMPRRDQR